MKQLIALHYPSFGGPHNVVLRLHSAFADKGWSTTVALPMESGDALERLTSAGIDTVELPLHRLRATVDPRRHLALVCTFPGEVQHLRALIREQHPDVAVVSGLVNPHLAVAAALERVPVVWQMTDNVVPASIRRHMMSAVMRLAAVVMFDGAALARHYLQGVKVRVPTFVYYPPVDCKIFVPSICRRHQTRSALGIPVDAIVVGTVANLIPLKGIVDFVRAASRIHASIKESWFLVVGAPLPTQLRYMDELREEVSRSGVPLDRFIFTGGRNDVERLYPAMDVKVIASHTESTTTTAMEAMSCGVPVVATDVGGVPEVVRAGDTGWIVPRHDPHALADACLRILRNHADARRMAARGREVALAEFDLAHCLDRHLEAYGAAMAR